MDNELDGGDNDMSVQNAGGKKSFVSKRLRGNAFAKFNLSQNVLLGVSRKGYNQPTPIQRKCIPEIIAGHDVVGMARTGSGKTAAYLIPMFERLRSHESRGFRALIITPTRELAVQTVKFIKELGKFTDLRVATILGGEKLEEQFGTMLQSPDVVIGTPGRLLHLTVEMDLNFRSVEYVVFDEADRLFELGFGEQLTEILQRLPESRQTIMFSATLPPRLVEFGKAGLRNPQLIRLDLDSKLPESLRLAFFLCRSEEKLALLLIILERLIGLGTSSGTSKSSIVFVSTRQHVDLVVRFLEESAIPCTYVHGALDPEARRENMARFRAGGARVLIVTDVAARGLDLPALENVVQFDFSPRAKLFVHRVGRVARAGRVGTAYSLVTHEDVAFLFDLHTLLGTQLRLVTTSDCKLDGTTNERELLGAAPSSLLAEYVEMAAGIRRRSEVQDEFSHLAFRCANATRKYVSCRPTPSKSALKRAKELTSMLQRIGVHPAFYEIIESYATANKLTAGAGADATDPLSIDALIQQVRTYKPRGTIFEINASGKHSVMTGSTGKRMMQHMRKIHAAKQGATSKKATDDDEAESENENTDADFLRAHATDDHFEKERAGGFETTRKLGKKKRSKEVGSVPLFIPYRPANADSERQLAVNAKPRATAETTSFEREANAEAYDVLDDDDAALLKRRASARVWDRQRKRFVAQRDVSQPKGGAKKRIRTENGVWIPATYKSGSYERWYKQNAAAVLADVRKRDEKTAGLHPRPSFISFDKDSTDPQSNERSDYFGNDDSSRKRIEIIGASQRGRRGFHQRTTTPGGGETGKRSGARVRDELKRPEQILKERKRKDQIRDQQKERQRANKQRRTRFQKRSGRGRK